MIMSEEYFRKSFVGERSQIRYATEINSANRFPNLAPKIMRADEVNLELVFEHIQGSTEECSDVTLYRIGDSLAQIHESYSILDEWRPSSITNRYENLSPHLTSMFGKAKNKVVNPKYGFTHGDYRRRNIISTNTGIKIIDWEFARESFIYWDIGIFIGDYVHQKFHGLQSNTLKTFWDSYLSQIQLSKSEVEFCIVLGGLDIIADHVALNPNEKPPIPEEMFIHFTADEETHLLDTKNYYE